MNNSDASQKVSDLGLKYKFWFFAGGESRDDRFNIFTGSFIRLMKRILENEFDYIKGIYFKAPLMNVIWALNNAQKVISSPGKNKITDAAFKQLTSEGLSSDAQLVITSSSSGSIVAAQTACYLAEANKNYKYFIKPFHLVLGASMISMESDLFRQLLSYQKENLIGKIIHDELQDEGDNSSGIGGRSRSDAYFNALGLAFPWFSRKFQGPSFLNTHPEKGHIHRRRSKTINKTIDYINVIMVKHKLGGDHYMKKAIEIIKEESS